VRELKARYAGRCWASSGRSSTRSCCSRLHIRVQLRAARAPAEPRPYALFLFCGILPWTWFSSSLLESSNVLISGGNLIKEGPLPAECAPHRQRAGEHGALLPGPANPGGIPDLLPRSAAGVELAWFPSSSPCSSLTLGLALIVSALTVHFRDLKDILSNLVTFWFFATPIIYSMQDAPPMGKAFLDMNPFTHWPCRTRKSCSIPATSALECRRPRVASAHCFWWGTISSIALPTHAERSVGNAQGSRSKEQESRSDGRNSESVRNAILTNVSGPFLLLAF